MNEQGDGKADGAGGAAAATVADVERLTNSLRFERAKNEVLLGEVIALEDEVVNRAMTDFDAVVSDETREFWREQLLTNRDQATAALTELARAKQGLAGDGAGTRRPLHNRSLTRPVAPAALGGGGAGGGAAAAAGEADDRAAKIRNRAHEISRAERVPFSAAFRRAERELGAS
jgi:hypothetical protein